MITRELHIDLSGKYNQKGDSIVSYLDREQPTIKHAVILRKSIKKALKKKFDINKVSNELHGVMVYLLLGDRVGYANKVVLCCDYDFRKVMTALRLLYLGEIAFLDKFQPLNEYRKSINDPKYRSCADTFCRQLKRHWKKNKNVHRRSDIIDYCNTLKPKEVEACLKYVLRWKLDTTESHIVTTLNKNLNNNLSTRQN